MPEEPTPQTAWAARWGLLVGPAVACGFLFSPPLDPTRPLLNPVAAVASLMAIWWITEAIPLAATSLLPLALYPCLKIMRADQVAVSYGNRMIFLFLGGFLIALAIEESGLHRRIALRIVRAMGDNPRMIVLGFMLATAMLSMWLSNTATTLMLLPVAASVLFQADQSQVEGPSNRNFGVALMLGIAYAASIGGCGTIVGTPPNVFFRGYFNAQFPNAGEITFGGWMIMAVPLVLVFLFVTWWLLVRRLFRIDATPILGGQQVIAEELRKLGPMSAAEWRMLAIFAGAALLWILREPVAGWGWAPALGVGRHEVAGKFHTWADDSTVAIAMASLCFLIPSGTRPGRRLLHWEATKRVPWGILLLFGGGIALADGMKAGQLDQFLGSRLAEALGGMHSVAMMGAMAAGMTFLTELTSNLASVQMILPVLGEASQSLHVAPQLLMIPATLAASCAFMLPVATPPNAIVYGSGRIRIRDMVKAGLWLNLVGIVLVVLTVTLLGSAVGLSWNK